MFTMPAWQVFASLYLLYLRAVRRRVNAGKIPLETRGWRSIAAVLRQLRIHIVDSLSKMRDIV